MAIAPVNKFLSIAVPVAPGEQKLYEVPTGTTAILLYAQVSNVGIGQTYPTATLIHRRESRSTGNKRDIRIIKDIEIPPNDAAILIDGRLVLEKTPLTLDRLFLRGVQSGVGTITNVVYHEPTGVATVTTMSPHNFNVGDPITMSGIAFTCSGSTGITTTIFPDPQQSYVVDEITNAVGVSRTFTAVIGSSKGYPHFYNPAIHYFVRSRSEAVTANTGTKFTPSFATYTGIDGVLTLTLGANHGLVAGSNTVQIANDSIIFTCTQDGNSTEHGYPRSTDPYAGTNIAIASTTTTTIAVNVGISSAGGLVAPLQMEFIASILENSTA